MRWLLLASVLAAVPIGTAPRSSVAEMADGAEYIVDGTVLRSWASLAALHHSVWTHYELSVID